jgi:hypothetical protein
MSQTESETSDGLALTILKKNAAYELSASPAENGRVTLGLEDIWHARRR